MKGLTFKNRLETIKVLIIYRYISLVVTSLFFLFGDITQSIYTKAFIITSISIAAIVLNYVYFSIWDCRSKVGLLILIETIGNTLILIPSGGINSPYVWYSLNTLLISSVQFGKKFVWLNLFIYLFGSTGLFLVLFQAEGLTLFTNSKNLILSLILITYAIQLLIDYSQKIESKNTILNATNQQLILANNKIKDSINYIMYLLQNIIGQRGVRNFILQKTVHRMV